MLNSLELIRELVALPGPPGQEDEVRDAVARHVETLGFESRVDAKGNLLVGLSEASFNRARVVVTAHLDEIALMVSQVLADGTLRVVPLGGIHPWKWGEQPVEIITSEPLPAVISFGSIHTESPAAVANAARSGPLLWQHAFLFTGLSRREIAASGIHPGVRVCLARDRRIVRELGGYICSYFLDDRADLVAWLLALEKLKAEEFAGDVLFAATTSEEVGGEGALFLMHRLQPEICVALEIGPSVPESPFLPDADPTIWVNDNYSSIAGRDLGLLKELTRKLGQQPHWQALSRGGSDASCAASKGLCARPITLGLPVENSHGYEIMHRDAPEELARLTVEVVKSGV
jgi:putative aminopeptidase FrvX